ncbi:MAG TPA: alpha/beta fold hydrolase [Candidatus Limnocylindrales bacterium]|nr:alpha/beta fold hydrolase [Candidatus Limnocylindrales bacterium]
MTKAIFIPGNGGGTPQDNWFPYLKTELENLHVNVIASDFPDSDLARAKYWLPFLKELGADENTILIGHSSGSVAAMKYAENNKILGSVLVGSYYTDTGDEKEKASGYFDTPWNWEAIKQNQKWIIQFASTDDPWIPIAEPRFVHDKLDTEYHEFTDKGHFGGDYHKPEFPELLAALKNKLIPQI